MTATSWPAASRDTGRRLEHPASHAAPVPIEKPRLEDIFAPDLRSRTIVKLVLQFSQGGPPTASRRSRPGSSARASRWSLTPRRR